MTKTEYMLIGSSQKLSTLSNPLEFSIDLNVPTEQVSSVKSLGYLLMKIYGGKYTLTNYLKKIASGIEAIKKLDLLSLHPLFIIYTMR